MSMLFSTKMTRIVFILLLIHGACVRINNADKNKRLLLGDPSVTANRLMHLENIVLTLNRTLTKQDTVLNQQQNEIQNLKKENQHLTTENQQQATTTQQLAVNLQQQIINNQQLTADYQTLKGSFDNQHLEIQKLKNAMSGDDRGVTYIRWARKQCTTNNTELVYSGYAGGGYYDSPGASAEPVCLPPDPEFGKTTGGDKGRMYGAEFDDNFFAHNSHNEGEDVSCSVCRAKQASDVIMIPGRMSCYSGWKREYYGYLASNYAAYKAAGTYVCIDIQPEFLTGGAANNNGKLFVEVLAKCGSLQCPPYKDNHPLTCVVCSK